MKEYANLKEKIEAYISVLESECLRPGFNGVCILEVNESLTNWGFDIEEVNELIKVLETKQWIVIPDIVNKDIKQVRAYPTYIVPNHRFNKDIKEELKELSYIINNPQKYHLVPLARLIKRGRLITELIEEIK